jgi:DNA-binding transcriptional LysR family regulator
MMNLDDLADFALVAANGGFAQASRVSGRPKASLSRKIMDLEAALGVRLFERTPRSLRLTEEGALLFERTSGPLNEIMETQAVLRDGRTKPHGQLRINVPTLFGHMLMGRLAAEFALAYPDVKLVITIEDRAVDLVNEGYDIAVRINPEPNSDLVGRCFVKDQVLIVSVPSFAEQFSRSEFSEQRPLPVVVRNASGGSKLWQIPGPGPCEIQTRTVLELPSLTMVRDAVLTGIGAAKLPRLLVATDIAAGRLVSWGPSSDRSSELWVLHASRRLASAKIRAFIQFLEASFPNEWV